MVSRRDFLKLTGAAAGTSLVGPELVRAATMHGHGAEFLSVLVDIPLCIGCRKCEARCAETHDLPVPTDIENKAIFDEHRDMAPDRWTVVNRYIDEDKPVYVKMQCMHCNMPGCDSACLVDAMEKTHEGPVMWHEERCMGCRYCMISCPFDVPTFEYDSAVPKIQKCVFCYERLLEGKIPACVESCPVDAMTFGTRREMMELARRKIYDNPDEYVHQIYGEHVVGGTSWLYISKVPFEKLGFATNLGREPIPHHTQDFLYSVPIILLLWPAFLFGISATRPDGHATTEEGSA